jgi:hypothetical protein
MKGNKSQTKQKTWANTNACTNPKSDKCMHLHIQTKFQQHSINQLASYLLEYFHCTYSACIRPSCLAYLKHLNNSTHTYVQLRKSETIFIATHWRVNSVEMQHLQLTRISAQTRTDTQKGERRSIESISRGSTLGAFEIERIPNARTGQVLTFPYPPFPKTRRSSKSSGLTLSLLADTVSLAMASITDIECSSLLQHSNKHD